MKIAIPWQACGQIRFGSRFAAVVMTVAFLLAAANLFAAPTVSWLSGGPLAPDSSDSGYGDADGDITTDATYHTPCGIAVDLTGGYVYVADRDNNEVRILQFDENTVSHLIALDGNLNVVSNMFSSPVGVAIDSSYNLFVLNYGNGTNGYVLEFPNYSDGFITNLTKLTNAAGIALDTSDNIYVTASNQVFKITPAGVSNVVTTITAPGASLQGIVMKRSGPTAGKLAVCDSGRNGIYLINPNSGTVVTNAGFHGQGDFISSDNYASSNSARFFQPTGVDETGDGTLIVTDYGNHRVKAVLANGAVTNLYGVASNHWVLPSMGYPGFTDLDNGVVHVPDQDGGVSARQPLGVAFGPGSDGTTPTIYVTEDYYHIIRMVTGAGLKPKLPWPPSTPAEPTATAGYGQVVLTWGSSVGATNYNVKRSTSSGGETTIASTSGTTYTYTDTGLLDGTNYYYVISALNTGGEGPNSIEVSAMPLFSPTPTNLIVTATGYGFVSLAWAPSAGATSYNLKRSTSSGGPYAPSTIIASTTSTTFTNSDVLNGTIYYYVVSAVNAGGENVTNSAEVSAYVPIPPPPPPVIGWFDYEGNDLTGFFSVLHAVSGANYYTAYNDLLIAINPTTNGLSTYYIATNGPQPVFFTVSSLTNSGSTPYFYQDGLAYAHSLTPDAITTVPDLVIGAVNIGPGGSSPIVTAEFRFQVGNPTINGNNGAQFTVSDITTNVVFWYTIDGTSPTNAPPSIGPIAITNGNPATLSINVTSNILFQARAFRSGYSPSGVAVQSFSAANFVPNSISFGFASGEASSDFVASPGQTFYAPVTLSPLAGTVIYSLQFNLTVTNGGPNPGPALGGPPAPFNFRSMLMKPIPGSNPTIYIPILPEMFADGGFTNLMFTNLVENLLGVGWVERYGKTNLYDTKSQTLITYSMAHDDMFPTASQPNGVIVGSYSFHVPVNARPNQTYRIQIDRPSATTDGIGTPGSSVFIYAPTNGSLAGGIINSIKNVTVGQRKYLAGNVYPFRWFNAGDFGNTNLQNADVEQVFQSAIYGLNYPPAGSDFFDAMDSCGGTCVDLGHGYLEFNNTISDPNALSALFDGNDTTINQIAFGDGQLDVCDVYVTYRRSLDTGSLLWFQRFWTNGVRVATANYAPVIQSSVARQSSGGKIKGALTTNSAPFSITNMPSVNFVAGDYQATAGQQFSIPVTASVFGKYPLRVLGLRISVVPLDGSPALTTPISFSPVAALGAPYTSDSGSNNIYAAAWLDNTIAGISNSATIGTLTVTIPANATSSSAYAVHFDHASGSPNGIASFPKHTFTGLITLSSRANSNYNDGIPDSWRLRWFGTIYNLLSTSNACPSGDGISNWKKYVAGVDPNTPNDFPSVNPNTPPPSGAAMSIYWPTVSGKQYAILSSASLFPGNWTTNAILTGTGANMEFDDHSAGAGKFYRVQILP